MLQQPATVCQLLHSLRVGGAEVLAARLAQQLSAQYRFLFVCLDELGGLGELLRAEGFPVMVLTRRPGLDWRSVLELAKVFRQEGVDLVHAHQYTPFFYGMIARLLYHRPPILFTEHGRHYPDYPRAKRILANRLLLEKRDRVVAVGEAVRQALEDNEGIRPQRVAVIYNGINFVPFENGMSDREGVRREIGLAADDLVILQVARLDYLKDHATAIRALERVIQHRRDARLVLIGEGPERDKIRDLIQQKHLEGYVRLLGLRNDVARLLRAADLFLLTSISEGIPLTVIEAMAAGLPVVATRVGGLSEIVEECQTGLLASSQDDADIAEKILNLTKDNRWAQEMGKRGRRRAKALFSESQMHAKYLALYREMLHA